MKETHKILKRHGFLQRENVLNDDFLNNQIRIIEAQFSIQLPKDYRYFLKTFDESEVFVGEQNIVLWRFEDLLTFNSEYLIFEDLASTFAIGSNGGGEIIAFDFLNAKSNKIIICPLVGMDRKEFKVIGHSILDMLKRLETGINWYN